MSESSVSEREVRRALREFDSAAVALLDADMQTFQGALDGLIHALNEPATREALRGLPRVEDDLARWFAERDRDMNKELRLPGGIDKRTAFILAVFRHIHETPENLQHSRVMALVGIHGGYAEMLNRFARRIVQPFVDDVRSRLTEQLPASANTGSGLSIGGDVNAPIYSGNRDVVTNSPGAITAQGGSRVERSSVVYQPRTVHGATLMQWANELDDVRPDRRDDVRDALEIAARAADGEEIRASTVVQAIETVAEQSPTLRERLRSFAHTVALHAAAIGVVHSAQTLAPLFAHALRLVFPDLPPTH